MDQRSQTYREKCTCCAWDLNPGISVTRFGNLFDFGQLFNAFGNNSPPNAPFRIFDMCVHVRKKQIIVKSMQKTFNENSARQQIFL